MATWQIEFSTRDSSALEIVRNLVESDMSIRRHVSGETVVLLSAAAGAATALIRAIEGLVREKQLTLRSQKLKIGKGALSFEGFDSEEIVSIIQRLKENEPTPGD